MIDGISMRKKLRKLVLIASAVGVIHFAIPLLLWGISFLVACKLGPVEWKALMHAIPAIILFLLFATTLFFAYKGFRYSLRVLLLSIILSITSFSYDALTRNWQMHVESMSGDNQGGTFKYFTWWWYSHY